MSKRLIITILLIVIAFAAIVIGVILLVGPVEPKERTAVPREFSPFPRFEAGEEEEGLLPPAPSPQAPETTPPAPGVSRPTNLMQLTDFAVAGAGFVNKEVLKNEEEADRPVFDFTNYPNLKLGASNTAVGNLQIVLNQFLAKKGETLLARNDTFDTVTKNAVILFQKDYGLPADGVVGSKTKIALNEFQKPEIILVPMLRFIDKRKGEIFEYNIDEFSGSKIVSLKIPDIGEILLGQNNSFLLRYIRRDGGVENFIAKMKNDNEFEVEPLPPTLAAANLSPDKKNIFYLDKALISGTDFRGAIGSILSLENGSSKKIFESAFSEWLVDWKDSIYLLTKPTFAFPGFLYKLDQTNGSLTKILGDINGLSTLVSPDGQKIIVSALENNNVVAKLYYPSERTFSDLGLRTLPEKCVFNKESTRAYCAVPKSIPTGKYPDEWYQGVISFEDDLWQIDLTSFTTNIIADLSGEPIDAVNLDLDDNEKNLIFINKHDGSLWLFKL